MADEDNLLISPTIDPAELEALELEVADAHQASSDLVTLSPENAVALLDRIIEEEGVSGVVTETVTTVVPGENGIVDIVTQKRKGVFLEPIPKKAAKRDRPAFVTALENGIDGVLVGEWKKREDGQYVMNNDPGYTRAVVTYDKTVGARESNLGNSDTNLKFGNGIIEKEFNMPKSKNHEERAKSEYRNFWMLMNEPRFHLLRENFFVNVSSYQDRVLRGGGEQKAVKVIQAYTMARLKDDFFNFCQVFRTPITASKRKAVFAYGVLAKFLKGLLKNRETAEQVMLYDMKSENLAVNYKFNSEQFNVKTLILDSASDLELKIIDIESFAPVPDVAELEKHFRKWDVQCFFPNSFAWEYGGKFYRGKVISTLRITNWDEFHDMRTKALVQALVERLTREGMLYEQKRDELMKGMAVASPEEFVLLGSHVRKICYGFNCIFNAMTCLDMIRVSLLEIDDGRKINSYTDERYLRKYFPKQEGLVNKLITSYPKRFIEYGLANLDGT